MRSRAGACLLSWVTRGLVPGIPYVMATPCSDVTPMAAGGMRADEAGALVPKAGWQRVSCADGSKGPRLYDRALIGTAEGRRQAAARQLRLTPASHDAPVSPCRPRIR